MVRIRRSHRRGPGSIPGQGTTFFEAAFLPNALFHSLRLPDTTRSGEMFVRLITKKSLLWVTSLTFQPLPGG